MRGIGIAHDGLRGSELLAEVDENLALHFHARQSGRGGHLRVAELADRGAIGFERLTGLLQVRRVLRRQFRGEAVDIGQRVGDGIQRRLLGVGLAAVGVTAYLITRLLQQLARLDNEVEVGNAVALQQGLLDFRDTGHGVVGGSAKLAACVFAVGTGLGHGGEGLLVFADGRQLLVDHGCVGRLFDHCAGGFQAGIESAEQVVDRACALFTTAHFVVQAGYAQVFGQVVEAGDVAELVAAVYHVTQAGPASEGDQQRQ
ncbi:hypothetical protein D3C73_792310 [compost metagenome]